jgi:hypothetical protein
MVSSKAGINEDKQSRALRLERFNKLQAIAGAQAQRSQQQLRLGLLDLVARIANVASLAADDHVRLRIQTMGDAVPKQRVLFQNQDAGFGVGVLFWGGHLCACALRDCGVLFAIFAEQMSSREFQIFTTENTGDAYDLIRKPGTLCLPSLISFFLIQSARTCCSVRCPQRKIGDLFKQQMREDSARHNRVQASHGFTQMGTED